MKLMIAGGGTAGHITPGLAVAAQLLSQSPDSKILWIGTEGRKESDLVPRHGIGLETLNMSGLDRSLKIQSLIKNAKTMGKWILGIPITKAGKIIQRFQPDFILGTGGYVCAPMLISARLHRIPTMILEQNSIPGLTVRFLSRIVDKVGIAYEMTRRYLPSASSPLLTGNPVLKPESMADDNRVRDEYHLKQNKKILLVVGGSLGSVTLNNAIVQFINEHFGDPEYTGWQVLHSTGKGKYNDVVNYSAPHSDYHPFEYLYHSNEALSMADLVVCRAGAMTLAEITVAGKPSIIVPWPGAVRNHQFHNAKLLHEAGAGILVAENEINGLKIAEIIQQAHANPLMLQQMSEAAKKLGSPDAAEKIVDYILGAIHH